MDTYSILREFADSWGLLAMFLFFLGVVLFTFRPGSRKVHRDAANIPLRHGDVLEEDILAKEKSPGQPRKETRK